MLFFYKGKWLAQEIKILLTKIQWMFWFLQIIIEIKNMITYILTDMMRLKRMPTKYGSKKEKKVEAFISRHAGGMSFDFQQRDTNMYVI